VTTVVMALVAGVLTHLTMLAMNLKARDELATASSRRIAVTAVVGLGLGIAYLYLGLDAWWEVLIASTMLVIAARLLPWFR
jgi:hypothetical protein